MSNIDTKFTGSIPEVYDSHLVPILFDGYAEELAGRVARGASGAVLEIAAGSGAVTRKLALLLPRESRYVVTDLNGGMLERARQHHSDDRLEWREADAMDLPFADGTFDAVVCQFGVMFFPDRVAAYSEIRRVLRPGGRFLFSSWGPLDENEFSNALVQTLIALYPVDPPLFLARTPFGYSDADRIRADVAAAGFVDMTVETVRLQSEAASADDFAFGQSYGSPLRLEIEARDGPSLSTVRESIATSLAARFGDGAISGRMAALVVEAIAP
ncbi:class I SAM-dependent methyltransferase [Lutimaribacter marinistellae]|uniref:Class I SAM-dependent methyltransferase n=1 Tax=Lutimaribacter marinistellae TaxID=1820329 RepID=A0ABV7TE50_9RHOB